MPLHGRYVAIGLLALVIGGTATGCSRNPGPEEVALTYGRALYAADSDTMWRLLSDADRRQKDFTTFRGQQLALEGFARDALGRLSRHITATSVKTSVTGDSASVTLKFRLPDANAPLISTLMYDWDETRLDRLGDADRTRIRERLDALAREGTLPIVEGDETIELVRENGRWRVFLNWAGAIHVTFAAATDPGMPIDARVTPAATVMAPGERLRVRVTTRNTTAREMTTRVKHRTEPQSAERYLALLQCPLLVPVRLAPGESKDFVSEYLLIADVPPTVKAVTVTYRFPVDQGSAE